MLLRSLVCAATVGVAAPAATSLRVLGGATAATGGGPGPDAPSRHAPPAAPPGGAAPPPALAAPQPLELGVPVSGGVGFAQLALYTFALNGTVMNASGDVYVLVTAVDGNPDLFVTLSGAQPGPGSYDYASANWAYAATEAVRINATDPQFTQLCAPLLARGGACTVGIGVYGSRAGNFTVVVEGAVGGTLVLAPGQPAVAPIPPGGVLIAAPFTDPLADTVNMALTGFGEGLNVLWGSSVRGGPPVRGQPASYCAAWSATTLNTNVFHAYNSSSDGCWCGPARPGGCTYYALVFTANAVPGASSVYAQWYVAYNGSGTNAPGTIETLLDGVPQGGDLSQGQYGYYIFNALVNPLLPEADVVVTLTPSLGDADLFITLDGSQPSSSNWQFQSVRGSGADVVEIETQSPAWLLYCAAYTITQSPCPVRIAVHGWSIQSSYVLTASVARQVTLLADLPFTSLSSGPGDARFFRYYAFAPGNFSFVLTPITGQPWMYISNDRCVRGRDCGCGARPARAGSIRGWTGAPARVAAAPCTYPTC